MSEPARSPGTAAEEVIFLAPGAGRHYDAGPMHAVFKADGDETADRYGVSEWWLEAGDSGPGPHSHEHNVELFYVIEGTMSFLAGDSWLDAAAGSFLRVPAGVTHDFENRSARARGRFERIPARRVRGDDAGDRRLLRRAGRSGQSSASVSDNVPDRVRAAT